LRFDAPITGTGSGFIKGSSAIARTAAARKEKDMQQTMEVNVSASATEWPRDVFTDLGIDAAAGREGAPDRVTAHKWFNIAAARGTVEAVRLRQELAAEMTADEIARAQREARQWLLTQLVS
jgi:hypothetical protein